MSNLNDQNYDGEAYGTGEAYREVEEVVVEEAPTYRVDPTYQTVDRAYVAPVAETRSFWSRFWWLIPLLALLIALPFLVRGCNREVAACTQVPATVFNTAAQDTAVAQLDGWVPGIADTRSEAVDALRTLCNTRLSHTGVGNWYDNNAITNAFGFVSGGISEEVATNIRDLVDGGSFCRCS
ncbi:MAG: hypothetical protein LBB58_04050 [Cellulomonadaceae bacterium]|jgi:hypothetical protein|nr:hypothetical protein [Cellulomonadaceae bacterium]